MPKVTYLFGAGASANCLPIVRDIPDRLNKFREFLVHGGNKREKIFENIPGNPALSQAKDWLIKEVASLIEKCRIHASIDTYAKKLFITQSDREYESLKAILTCFFLYEQMANPVD
ncbi:MAG TPA: hypothetical protein VE035_12220, partial [Puia sp.]|nr:hypothetical protein [Puia sp.]